MHTKTRLPWYTFVAEILLKVALKHKKSNQSILIWNIWHHLQLAAENQHSVEIETEFTKIQIKWYC